MVLPLLSWLSLCLKRRIADSGIGIGKYNQLDTIDIINVDGWCYRLGLLC